VRAVCGLFTLPATLRVHVRLILCRALAFELPQVLNFSGGPSRLLGLAARRLCGVDAIAVSCSGVRGLFRSLYLRVGRLSGSRFVRAVCGTRL